VRLDGDEMAADADDGDAGHATGTYMNRPAIQAGGSAARSSAQKS
jgi:hypothetical protein